MYKYRRKGKKEQE